MIEFVESTNEWIVVCWCLWMEETNDPITRWHNVNWIPDYYMILHRFLCKARFVHRNMDTKVLVDRFLSPEELRFHFSSWVNGGKSIAIISGIDLHTPSWSIGTKSRFGDRERVLGRRKTGKWRHREWKKGREREEQRQIETKIVSSSFFIPRQSFFF